MTDTDALMHTERRWVAAHRSLNIADIRDILDDDYLRIEDNTLVGKAETVASYASGQRHWDVAEASDYSVQVFTGTAMLSGLWRGVGVNHGQAFNYRARFFAIYIKRPEGWKLFRDESFELFS